MTTTEAQDRLAGLYVLGLLTDSERQAFEFRLAEDTELQARVDALRQDLVLWAFSEEPEEQLRRFDELRESLRPLMRWGGIAALMMLGLQFLGLQADEIFNGPVATAFPSAVGWVAEEPRMADAWRADVSPVAPAFYQHPLEAASQNMETEWRRSQSRWGEAVGFTPENSPMSVAPVATTETGARTFLIHQQR